jgi:hypothetical protein
MTLPEQNKTFSAEKRKKYYDVKCRSKVWAQNPNKTN